MNRWYYERNQEHLKEVEERMKPLWKEAWMRLLRVSEQQWKTIGPREERVGGLRYEARRGALGGPEPRPKQGLIWQRHSKGTNGTLATPPDKMTEGQKIADALADLLEDPNSTDQQIREKIDALQQARENARKALPKAKQELAAVLTTPRQEAIFLLKGSID